MRKRTDILERKLEILQWITEGQPNTEIARRLNCKVDTLKSYYVKMGITYSGNQCRKGFSHKESRKNLTDYLNSNVCNSKKRIRLIDEGIKEEKCEICGLSEWMNKPIPLELHHKDFNHFNNELSNLQILCSNCHMQTHNYNNNYKE